MWTPNDPMPEPDSVESVARTYTMKDASDLLVDAAARVDDAANFSLYLGSENWYETRVNCVRSLLDAHARPSTVRLLNGSVANGPSPLTVWQAAGLWSEGPTHYAAFGYLWDQYLELVCDSIVGFMQRKDHESHIAGALRLRWVEVSDDFAASPMRDFMLKCEAAMSDRPDRQPENASRQVFVTVHRDDDEEQSR